ncbi:MAG: hypothetical protein EXX96DRAFT_582557 [Benjaminiella poitrasii]|nr:MAG: hypothetical protein EXX96DRAFT_582557 [Benjaminiella poitrasii]
MEGSNNYLTISTNMHEHEEEPEIDISRPRSASLRRSWPLLPRLQLVTSNGNEDIKSPTVDQIETRIQKANDDDDDNDDDTSSISMISEEDEEEDIHMGDELARQRSTKRSDSAGTLVEAALDQAEAQDRHSEFPRHIQEAGQLVQNLINTKFPSATTADTDSHQRRRSSRPEEPDDIEMQSTYSPSLPAAGGGGVLASLMKLEAQQRRTASTKRRQKSVKRKKKKKSGKKTSKPVSLYNFKLQSSSTDGLTAMTNRPNLAHRPTSWLSTITTTNHLVPNLPQRRQANSVNLSRRSSLDSLFTTASQFEPITLEDRIRITFEIANILQKHEFLLKLVKSLMLYGAPAHRLEYILREVSKTLGVEAEYVYIPNVMFLSFFDSSTHTTETHFVRSPQLFDMHKLGEIFRLEKLVAHGEVTVDEALEFIDKVAEEPQFYPVWLNPFAYALASFCGCVMFYGGQFKEGGLSAALAIFFATYELFSGRYMSFQPIWEITVCVFIGFVSRAVWRYGFCFTPVAFASFIIILPGYSMAVALIELVSRQLVCGAVRIVYAIIYSFLLGYGIEMGSEIFGLINPESISAQGQASACVAAINSTTCVTIIPQAYYFMTVPLFAVAYCIYLRARLPRWPIMIAVASSGFVVNWALSCRANAPSQVLQVVPAFVVGLLGNLLTKITGKMSLDAVILGVFYLVPGSLGLKAALGFFGNSGSSEFANQGAGFALSMIETSIGITVGLFIATLLVYPKGSQHTPLMNF